MRVDQLTENRYSAEALLIRWKLWRQKYVALFTEWWSIFDYKCSAVCYCTVTKHYASGFDRFIILNISFLYKIFFIELFDFATSHTQIQPKWERNERRAHRRKHRTANTQRFLTSLVYQCCWKWPCLNLFIILFFCVPSTICHFLCCLCL